MGENVSISIILCLAMAAFSAGMVNKNPLFVKYILLVK